MKNNYLKKIMLIFPALFLIMSCIVPVKAYASTCPHAGSVSISTIKATCTKKGKKVVKCSRCGKVLSTQTTGNALGHKWKVEQKSATESERGYYRKSCTRCNKIDKKIIYPKICRHVNNGQFTYNPKPTCTSSGYKIQKCTKCGEILSRTAVKKLGHYWTETKKNPTKTKEGCHKKYCKRCKKKLIDKTYPKLEFKYKGKYKCDGFEFNAAGILVTNQNLWGTTCNSISGMKDKFVAEYPMSCNYKLVVECTGNYVYLVNQTKDGKIYKATKKITLGTNSLGLMVYCAKVPLNSKAPNRKCTITIKDEFGRVLKTLNVKQRNDYTFNGYNKTDYIKIINPIVKKLCVSSKDRNPVRGDVAASYMKQVLNGDVISNKVVTCYGATEAYKNLLFAACTYIVDDVNVRINYMTVRTATMLDPSSTFYKTVGVEVEDVNGMSIETDPSTAIIKISEQMTKHDANTVNKKKDAQAFIINTTSAGLKMGIGAFFKKIGAGVVGKGILAAGNKLAKLYCVKVKSDKTKVKYNNELRLKKGTKLKNKDNKVIVYSLADALGYTYNLKFVSGDYSKKYTKTWTKSGKF